MIDIHMIDSGRFHENAAMQLQRVKHDLVITHVAKPVWGDVAAARKEAYSMGSQEFVSWIDDDDIVVDVSWLPHAVEILKRHPEVSAVYPRWFSIGAKRMETPIHQWSLMKSHRHLLPFAHHMTIMRRANVEKFFATVDRPLVRDQDLLLVASQARYGRLVSLSDMAYCWVLSEGSARCRVETPEVNAWGFNHWRETVLEHRRL